MTIIGLEASGTKIPEDWFFEAMTGGRESASGVAVSPRSVLAHPAVYQAVKILTGDIGQLPVCKMLRRFDGDHEYVEKDVRHPAHQCLNYGPNHYQTPSQWKETVMHDALLYGNHVSLVSKSASGETTLTPLPPQGLSYYQPDIGQIYIRSVWNGRQLEVPYDEVFHMRGLATAGNDGSDGNYQLSGFWGLPVISLLRDALGAGLAMIEYGASLFKNNGRPSGVLQFPGAYSAEAARNLRNEWHEIHGGPRNAGKIAVLYEDGKFTPIAMTNDEAQFLDLRRLDREIVASVFNLPPYKLGAMENSAVRANVEEQKRDYMQQSLTYWTNKFSEEFCRKLLKYREQRDARHYFKWDFSMLLQADTQARYTAYATGIAAKFLNPNEVRQREGLNPYDGGDKFLNPAIDTNQRMDDESEAEDTEDSVPSAKFRLVSELTHSMLTAVGTRAKASSSSDAKFTGWMERFFDADALQAFVAKFLGSAAELLDLDCHVALEHLAGVQASFRHAVDLGVDEQRRHCVSNYLESIDDRASELAHGLMRKSNG